MIRIRILPAIAVLTLVFEVAGIGQSNEDYYARIRRKIDVDRDYSNLYYVSFVAEDVVPNYLELPNAEKKLFRANDENTSYRYRLIFLNSVDGVDTLVPLRVTESRTAISKGVYSQDTGSSESPLIELGDFLGVKNSTNPNISGQYSRFLDLIRRIPDHVAYLNLPPKTLLTHGVASQTNADYINYQKVNSNQPFPDTASAVAGRRLEAGAAAASAGYQFDISFSQLSFAHQAITDALGMLGFGFEAGFGDRVLNLVSYQAPYLSWGGRFLGNFSGNKKDLYTQPFFDLKVLVRSRVNTYKLMNHLTPGWYPVVSLDKPKLNVTSGATIDLSVAKFLGVPFVNFYYSVGNSDFKGPYVTQRLDGIDNAYFSTSQLETSLSFYWNADASMQNLFRIDVGAGAYDIWQVRYDNKGEPKDESKIASWGRVQPLIALDYTRLSPGQRTLFGAQLRFFDNRVTLKAWLKLLKIDIHELRLESIYISSPIGRSMEAWENGSGTFMQLRYRLGF